MAKTKSAPSLDGTGPLSRDVAVAQMEELIKDYVKARRGMESGSPAHYEASDILKGLRYGLKAMKRITSIT